MLIMIVLGLLAGMITILSPCVLPVLPVILTAAVPGPQDADQPQRHRSLLRRPFRVVAGLVISFSLSTLFGSLLLSALHLPQNLLRIFGIVALLVIGLGLLWPRLGELLERPFASFPSRQVKPEGNGLVLGLGLGLLFVPCAGPVLTTIVVVGATHDFNLRVLVLTFSFALGIGLPLLVLAQAGQAVSWRMRALLSQARKLRAASGVIMIVIAIMIGLHLTDGLQRSLPGYTEALEQKVEGSPQASSALHTLASGKTAPLFADPNCTNGAPKLVNCGAAPELTGLTGWLNTPGNAPMTLASLRGKVVLLDFWTYSCINCQRTLPHLEAWYRAYQKAGLVIIGVHTPEFAFEHVPANVASQAHSLGVNYPIAIDNNYATWSAYSNQSWPSDYLLDPDGAIQHYSFGEGGYATTEKLIRQLLTAQNPKKPLPPPTEVPDNTPVTPVTEETYLGYHHAPFHTSGTAPSRDQAANYQPPATVNPGTFALSGNWTSGAEALTSGPGARLQFNCQAHDVYLVMAGQGNVTVNVPGRPPTTIAVSGVPKLYSIITAAPDVPRVVDLGFTPGVRAYDFTFG